MVLAERLGRAGHVEVAQGDAAQPVGPAVPGQRALERALRLAVRVDRAEGRVLGDRGRVRDAVDRGGRGEDDPLHAGGPSRIQQRDAAGDVVAEVAGRLADRLADQRARRAMEDRLDPLAPEQAAQRVAGRRSVPSTKRGAVGDRRAMAGRQVVEDDDLVAGREERGRRRPSRRSRRRR